MSGNDGVYQQTEERMHVEEGEVSVQILPETNSRVWLKQEDELLMKLVQVLQPKKWTHIAKELNTALYGGRQIKAPKQCRERWHNHLDPNLKKGDWTLEEDIYILESQIEQGNCWSKIAKRMPYRNENNVKNRWNSFVKQYKKEYGPDGFTMQQVLADKQEALRRQKGAQSVDQQSSPSYSSTATEASEQQPVPQQSAMMFQPISCGTFSSGSESFSSVSNSGANSVSSPSGSFGSFGEVLVDPYTGQPIMNQGMPMQQPNMQMFMAFPSGFQGYNQMMPGQPQPYPPQQPQFLNEQNVRLPNVFEEPPNP